MLWTRTESGAEPRTSAFLLAMIAGTACGLGSHRALAQAAEQPAEGPPAVSAGEVGELNGAVTVDQYDLVDLHVNEADLGSVLQLLSLQSQRNIVMNNAIDATVTADLYGVTFYEALDAILNVNGFGYIERGNFIYVYTQDELEQQQAELRKRVSRVIRLDYLNAPDAAQFVAPLLSEGGSITTPGRTEEYRIGEAFPVGKDDYANDAILLVYDFEENVDEILALIGEIDTRPAQVLIEATILQTSLSEANAFGVDFSIIADLDFTDFLSPLSAADSLITGIGERIVDGGPEQIDVPLDNEARALSSNVANLTGPATLKAGIVMDNAAVFLRVLDEVTDVTVISNPKVLTLNRQPARVLVGTRVGFLNTTVTDNAAVQTVEFLDTGTQLHVRPFVTNDGLIRLELKPEVSSFSIRQVTGDNITARPVPDQDTTELVTNMLIRDGQTVVLGGLFTETTTATRRQVPVLGDIPLIGAAFRGNDDSTRRSEIIFLVTPSIVNDEILTLEGEQATAYVDRAVVGARQGLLPWSRERQVGQLLIDAERLRGEGRIEKARHKVQRALTLSPFSPDAIRMLEELGVERTRWPTRNLLRDMMENPESRLLGEGSPAPAGDRMSVPERDVAQASRTPAFIVPAIDALAADFLDAGDGPAGDPYAAFTAGIDQIGPADAYAEFTRETELGGDAAAPLAARVEESIARDASRPMTAADLLFPAIADEAPLAERAPGVAPVAADEPVAFVRDFDEPSDVPLYEDAAERIVAPGIADAFFGGNSPVPAIFNPADAQPV
ncbi:MAG: hypothetical protein AAFU70_01010, partial [Planctomycetota bacterium]